MQKFRDIQRTVFEISKFTLGFEWVSFGSTGSAPGPSPKPRKSLKRVNKNPLPPSTYRGTDRGVKKLAYVVERHASACLQTAGVDAKWGRRLELRATQQC